MPARAKLSGTAKKQKQTPANLLAEFLAALAEHKKLIDELRRINYYSPVFDYYATPPFAPDPGDDELKTASGNIRRSWANQKAMSKSTQRLSTLAKGVNALFYRLDLSATTKESDALSAIADAAGSDSITRNAIEAAETLANRMKYKLSADRPPLGKVPALIFDHLIGLPHHKARTAKKIVDWLSETHDIHKTEQDFHKEYRVPLESWGMVNHPRYGYSIPPSARPKK
jgi:hypothetical protein